MVLVDLDSSKDAEASRLYFQRRVEEIEFSLRIEKICLGIAFGIGGVLVANVLSDKLRGAKLL